MWFDDLGDVEIGELGNNNPVLASRYHLRFPLFTSTPRGSRDVTDILIVNK
jgi:hypothetical protein